MQEDSPVVFLARQPIYDRRMQIYGYELLFRQGASGQAGLVEAGQSADTIVRAVADIGLQKLVEDKPAFVNVPWYLLGDPAIELLPKERVVLEILEDTEPSEANLEAAAALAAKGYKLALDDFVMGAPQAAFLPYCKIVKLDLPGNNLRTMPLDVKQLKKQGLRVLAEKVETTEMYGRCHAASFDYFQGYFFAKPDLVSSRKVPENGTMLLRLMSMLCQPGVKLSEIQELVSTDLTLSFRLLKLVNSASVALDRPIDSLQTALLVLGTERIVALISLLAMVGLGCKSNDLLTTAMVRAKMCEGLSNALDLPNPSMHFTVGLLSVLEAMFDTPMAELLESLPLAHEIKEALIDPASPGSLGKTLRLAIAFEQGNWTFFDGSDDQQAISKSYVSAVTWATETKQSLAAA